MSNYEPFPMCKENTSPEPLIGNLLVLHNLWQSQLPVLGHSGVLAQAVDWAERDGEFKIDVARTHVFVEVGLTDIPWRDELPDDWIAFNGLMLSGTARGGRHAVIERELIPVHIGMYRKNTDGPKPDPDSLAFGRGDLMEPPGTVLEGFEDVVAKTIHDLAITVQLEAAFADLPVNRKLSLPPRLMDLAFASPSSLFGV